MRFDDDNQKGKLSLKTALRICQMFGDNWMSCDREVIARLISIEHSKHGQRMREKKQQRKRIRRAMQRAEERKRRERDMPGSFFLRLP